MTNSGERRYELVPGWGQLPDGWVWGQVGGVAVDAQDRVHAFTRSDQPCKIFDRGGALLDSWGAGIFEDAHSICITPDGTQFYVDRVPQLMMKFDAAGRHRLTIGRRNQHSETGYTEDAPTVLHPGPPFHHPTDVSVEPDGTFYVSDGYRNCRIHKFAPDGTLLLAWGEPGSGPGQFVLPHSVWWHRGRVYVADRGNNRIQVFTPDGAFIEEWPGFLQPCKIFIDDQDVLYLAELGDRVSVLDLRGNVLARWGAERSHEPGLFWGPHGIWVDSVGDVYVAEVLEGARLQKFARTR